MASIRRATILKLAATAHEIDLDVMNGVVTRDANGRWHIGGHDLTSWLERMEDHDVALVLGDLSDEREVVTRTCRTCGRDYTDLECPYCRANRIRLRGHA